MYEGIFAIALLKTRRSTQRSYTMQNGRGARLFRREAKNIFCESGNKSER
jgi:hypothetical protein